MIMTFNQKETAFLSAMAKGKHRKGAGNRLRKIIADRELALYGAVACFCCGKPLGVKSATIEHIYPQSLGGKTIVENLALSHAICNEARGSSGTPRTQIYSTGEQK
jgi:5-methylcytosine-specific restriction endonuclease McrA